jgi:hypothetical protein
MRRADDSWGEMHRPTSERLEQVLAGDAPEDEETAHLAAAVRRLRTGLLEAPSEAVAARHLAAMTAAARAATPSLVHRRSPMRVLTGRRAAVVALAAAMTLTGGLAWAGALPTPAQDAIAGVANHLGLDLPSSDDRAPAAEHGAEVSQVAQDPSLEGCEKGQAVAAVASEKSEAHRQDPAEKQDPCTQGDEGPGASTERSPGPPEGVPANPSIPEQAPAGPPEGVPAANAPAAP